MTDSISTERLAIGLAAVLLSLLGWLFNIIVSGQNEIYRELDDMGQRVSHLEGECYRRAKDD